MADLPLALRRVIAIGLLLVLVTVLWIYLLGPWFEQVGIRQTRLDMLQRQLSGNQALLASEGAIDAQLLRLDQLRSGQALLFPGAKPALAAADLRELISKVISESGGQLVSVQEYESVSLPATQAIGLRAHLTGEVQNLLDILYGLESARPLIFVEQLTITSTQRSTAVAALNNRRVRARPNSSMIRANSLDIRLDLSAYIMGAP